MVHAPCQRALVGVLVALAVSRSTQAQCPQFTQRFSGEGLSSAPLVLCSFDDGSGPRLFAGGNFRGAGAEPAHHVAVWDGERWAAAGALPTSASVPECRALLSHDAGAGARLYSGGTGFVALWDGAAWNSIGTPLGASGLGSVHALASFDVGSGPELIAAGVFQSIGGVAASRVARWDGVTWRPFGGGPPGAPFALAVHDDGTGEKLYAGGNFNGAVVVWHGASWVTIGQPLGDEAQIDSMASIRGPAGEHWLLVAGQDMFTNNTVFARWDGATWVSIAAFQLGLVEQVLVHQDALGPVAYLTGLQFGEGRVWSWRPGAALVSLANMPFRGYSLSMHTPPGATDERLFAGGDFTWIGGVPAQRVAQLQGSQWSALGVGAHGFIPKSGDAAPRVDVAVAWTDERDGRRKLVVGGDFAGNVDDPSLRGLAVWDGERWSAFPVPVPGPVSLLTTWNDPSLGKEVLVGYPISVGAAGSLVRKFDGVQWVPIGPQAPSLITELATYRENGSADETLFIYGPFIDAALGLNYIGRFDGANWVSVGEGVASGATGLVVHDPPGPLGPGLYVNTRYLQNGVLSATSLSRWDGTSWTAFPAPPNSVSALAVFDDGAGERLFAVDSNRLHRFDGVSWSQYSTPAGNQRTSLAAFDDGSGPALYLPDGHRFRGGQIESFVPPNSTFSASALVAFEDENGQSDALWLVGRFDSYGGVPSRGVARWSDPCRALTTYCTAQTSSLGCVAQAEWTGEPSVAASTSTPFEIAARDTPNNKSGLCFYGRRGPNSAPLGGGTLCVRAPIRRTPITSSGGSPSGDDCTGRLALDFSAWIRGEVDPSLEIGAQVWCQWWYRDPLAASGSALSDGLSFEIRP